MLKDNDTAVLTPQRVHNMTHSFPVRGLRPDHSAPIVMLLLLLGSLLASSGAWANIGDARILAAREAFRTGDRVTLERLAAREENHPLDQYVPYWLLLNKLARPEPAPESELRQFLARNSGTVIAERLLAAWLKRLATDQDWDRFLREFSAHPRPDEELRCLYWQARLARPDANLAQDLKAVWPDWVAPHAACEPAVAQAATRGLVGEDALWWRLQRQVDSRKPEGVRTTLAWLKEGTRLRAALDQILSKPATYLDNRPAKLGATRGDQEMLLAALTRLAREDVAAAHVRLARLDSRLPGALRARAYATLGYHGALSRHPLALSWYQEAGEEVELTAPQRAWRVRAAIRAQNWPAVEWAISALPLEEQVEPEWLYWRARALASHGEREKATTLYRSIAGQPHFYGLLAADELGEPFQPPGPDETPTTAALKQARSHPAVTRALALYRLELTTEAVREWIAAVRGQERDFLIAAAHVALEHKLFDRAINTAELADPNANFRLRFLTPYRELIERHVRQQGLDLAWVYGLMRQESRFNIPARSSAGAQGLMQVMPATGKWVAGKIGLKNYHPRMLQNPDTNVLIGTQYMRLILEDLGHHPVLASAGYNAGPGRARRWRDSVPLEGAIYAETIPIDETRDYVKKVMTNAVIYASLFESRPQSLKARLGMISP